MKPNRIIPEPGSGWFNGHPSIDKEVNEALQANRCKVYEKNGVQFILLDGGKANGSNRTQA